LYNDTESALAFSWQNVPVEPGGTVVRACIVKFGEIGPSPVLALNFETFEEPFPAGGSIKVTGSAVGDGIRVVLIVDDFLNAFDVNATFSEESEVRFDLRPSEYQIGDGFHRLGFYGVDSEGDISPPVFLNITIGKRPESESSESRAVATTEVEEEKPVNQLIPIVVAVSGALLVAAGTAAIFFFGRKHDQETRIGGSSSMNDGPLVPGYSDPSI
jgi:hypothetical protein